MPNTATKTLVLLGQNICITMAHIWLYFILLLDSAISVHVLQLSDFKAFPEKGTVSGVFLLSSSPQQYLLNARAARETCQQLGVTLATMVQVKEANARGLEMCRYGWIDEQIAVIPRITSSKNCGQGRTGISVWRADASKKFDAFCFNATGVETQSVSATADSQPSAGYSSPPSSSPHSSSSVPIPISLTHLSYTPPPIYSSPSPFLSIPSPGHTDVATATPTPTSVTVIISVITAALLALVSGALYYGKRKRSWLQFCMRDLQSENKDTEEIKPSGKQDTGGDQAEIEVDGNSNDISLSVIPDMQQPSP